MKTRNFTFKLSEKQRILLEQLAQKERRTKGSLLCNLIDDYAKAQNMECLGCRKVG